MKRVTISVDTGKVGVLDIVYEVPDEARVGDYAVLPPSIIFRNEDLPNIGQIVAEGGAYKGPANSVIRIVPL